MTTGQENKKILLKNKEKFKSQYSNPTIDYISSLGREKLWIRNRNLVEFIISTKGQRLSDISGIIGFEQVVKTKSTFKKASNDLKSLIRTRDFEGQISRKKSVILEKLKATINTREQFFSAINNLLKPLEIGIEIIDFESFKEARLKLKSGLDPNEIKKRTTLGFAIKVLEEAIIKIPTLGKSISDSVKGWEEIKTDKEAIKNLSVYKLLEEADKVLKVHEKDNCPLCSNSIKREDLILSVNARLQELKHIREKHYKLKEEKEKCLTGLREIYQTLNNEIKKIKEFLPSGFDFKTCEDSLSEVTRIGNKLKEDLLETDTTTTALDESLVKKPFENLSDVLKNILKEKKGGDVEQRTQIYGDIEVSSQYFKDIKDLETQKIILENQQRTLDKIYTAFTLHQKAEMQAFLKNISDYINEFYFFMNESTGVDGISLTTMDNSEGEFVGIQLTHKFHGQTVKTPKQYLSESYINCIGLCIFLATVKLLNKQSKFFVLDDVISSFDKNHRIKFGQLLLDKFSDYQIFILTHETDWFDFMSTQGKGRGWKINEAKWNPENGIILNLAAPELKIQIDEKIQTNNENGLGNLLRRYGERLLKDLCFKLEAKASFQYNDRNENRQMDELLGILRGQLSKKSIISDDVAIKNLASSKFVANRTSHDGFSENIHDLKAFNKDLYEFNNLFLCNEGDCLKNVSLENFNRAKQTISCPCGKKEITWKD